MVSLKKKRLVFTIDRFFHIQKGVFMNLYKYKGKRIRASDKNLVYRFCAGTLLLLFVAVLLLLNMGQLMRTSPATEHGTAHAYRLGAFQFTR